MHEICCDQGCGAGAQAVLDDCGPQTFTLWSWSRNRKFGFRFHSHSLWGKPVVQIIQQFSVVQIIIEPESKTSRCWSWSHKIQMSGAGNLISGVKRNHWLHAICACAERWYSRSCISQAVAVHREIKFAENWWLGFRAVVLNLFLPRLPWLIVLCFKPP